MVLLNIQLSKTGFNWNKSPAAITLRAPNGVLVPIICCSLKLRKLNIPLPTIDISSMKITCSLFNCALIVLSRSASSVQYWNPLLAGILNAEWSVFPLILNAALPVGATFNTLTSSGFSPGTLFKYLMSASYRALVTVLLPTPAPPLKNNARGSSLVLIECKTW